MFHLYITQMCSFSLILFFHHIVNLDRKTITEQEEEHLRQLVYNFLKGRNENQTQIKCNVGDGPIGDLVEEITINRPILVSFFLLLLLNTQSFFGCTFAKIGFCMLQLNDAKFEDIEFFVYSVNDHGAEVETINVSGFLLILSMTCCNDLSMIWNGLTSFYCI